MNKTAVFVLGPDRPGIIAAVAQTLFEQGCNLEDVSRTSLQAQFVGIQHREIFEQIHRI